MPKSGPAGCPSVTMSLGYDCLLRVVRTVVECLRYHVGFGCCDPGCALRDYVSRAGISIDKACRTLLVRHHLPLQPKPG